MNQCTRSLLILALVFCAGVLATSCGDPMYSGNLAQERQGYSTKLTRKGPSPQEAGPISSPPRGAKLVSFPSGRLKLSAWVSDLPAGAKKRPAVVYCHGGFAFGADDWDQAEPFRKAGYIVMIPILRGENGGPGHFEMFYGEVDDAIAAGKFLQSMPGVDPQRIYIAGHSAGGTIACLAALMPSPFAAAAGFGATTDMEDFVAPRSEFRFMAPFDPTDATEVRLRSVVPFIRNLQCPLFLYAGSHDGYARRSMQNLDTLTSESANKCETAVVDGDHFTSVAASIEQTLSKFNGLAKAK